jgi:hypothetical protein
VVSAADDTSWLSDKLFSSLKNDNGVSTYNLEDKGNTTIVNPSSTVRCSIPLQIGLNAYYHEGINSGWSQ